VKTTNYELHTSNGTTAHFSTLSNEITVV